MPKEKDDKELTTISVTVGTRRFLESFKVHPNQSYEEVILDLAKQAGVQSDVQEMRKK